ncbi:MAG: hypothetical protein CFE24_14730 [Flavobacterium sp. BFFFF2]|nr:MAG: hypothetical protein CFE24_14730 [Flavobacterium sp. BFFFF2]
MKKQNEIINELKSFWGVREFLFEAQFAINRKGNGFFRNLRKTSDKSKIFLPNGSQLTVGVTKDLKFEEDKSYLISVFVPNDEIRTKFENDYTILLDTKKSPPKALESAPESYVKSLEREYKSVIGIGLDSLKGAIKRISYDINRKPETFIFELLQNADDYPDKKVGRVVVSFKIVGEYLVFQHNGLPFSGNNVRALCSVDAGDKEYDFEKIGYKGIGFKSIFKHSNYVVIHSGGYTFKFDENYHRSKGIDTFWQLIPIWTDLSELPEIVQNQVSNNFNVTVIIKPEEGNSQLKSYEETFNAIFKDERVLLFLRHVEHFSFRGATTNIVKRRDSDTWAISKLDAVVVPYELQKTINAKLKVDDRIPQKYEDIEKTVLTFATRKIEGKIKPTEQAHLYAYLPTDLDFGFPFLLNGDFIPDGGRHYLHADLEWNQFLFREAGKNLLKWIAALWSENNDNGAYDMLPDEKKLVSERPGDEKEILLKCFLDGLSEAKNATKFIAIETNELCSVSEIVLDDTGLFSEGILPNSLYYNISNSAKKLPNPQINLNRLFSSYLGLEKFTSKQLIDILSNDENKEKLKEAIKSIETNKYLEFLGWLNTFCYLNNVSNFWLLSMPIFLTKGDIFSLTEVLSKDQFILKNHRTKNVEGILSQIGFELSDIYIDDESYQYLYGILLQQDSYLKSDLKLYEHIAAAKDLSKLTATEKNTLITFFESLDEVGKAKYAKSLALFKSKQVGGSSKPLNSLISNCCAGLPTWLNDFVIDAEEEKALSTTFQTHLLKEKDLLEKLFCNAAAFNEVKTNINSGNIEEFYTYLLKLLNNKPEETKIDFSLIPWVFLEENSKFVLASTVYWPESITKLASAKYASVKSVFEIISVEQLPHFSALQIKGPFALGSKEIKLNEITPHQNSFDVVAVNDFLDWAEANGEKGLLNQLSFTKVDDKFSMGKVSGTLCYYTADDSLITFINASAINTKLSLFSKELYAKERYKIGLLEGVSLLKYLIENGLSTPVIAKFIQGANDAQLSLQYLEMLTELNIESSKSYTIEDAEFKILKLVVQHLVDDDAKLATFKKKIFLDNHSLAEKAFSDDVRFYKPGAAILEIKTKLKEILPAYQNQTYSISDVISKFIDFHDDPKLIKIFKSESRSPSRIYRELNELKPPYFSPTQTFFLSYYKTLNPNEDVFLDKILFTNANSDNQAQLIIEIHEFLDICLKENSHTKFVAQGVFSAFNPANLVSTEEFAIASEKLPTWLSEWINKSDTENKKDYLKLLGINNDDSPVVLYRKAIKEAQPEQMNINRELINNDQLLFNTLFYLSYQQKQADLILKKEVLQPLYQKLLNRKIAAKFLLFPSLLSFQQDSYSLDKLIEGQELHFFTDNWGDYKMVIFSNLVKTNKITDDVLPKAFRAELKVIEQTVVRSPDIENIKANSYPFDDEYYQEWNLKNQYNIQIYKGNQLPYLIKYNNIIINNVKDKVADCIEKVYYVVESKKESILIYLEGILPESALNDLKLNKQNLIEKEKEAEKKIKFTEEESAAWKKLFGNEIPEAYYQDINLAACVSALVYLNNNGYDVSKADSNLFNSHGFAQVEPVYKGELNERLTIMCRSAIGGILYLTAQAWDRLENKEVHLFVKTGRKDNNHHLFMDKNDVLKISDTKYQVFRVEADSSSATTDEILRGEFAKDKIWLILKIKETDSYKSIFEGGIKRNEEKPDYENINTSENSDY